MKSTRVAPTSATFHQPARQLSSLGVAQKSSHRFQSISISNGVSLRSKTSHMHSNARSYSSLRTTYQQHLSHKTRPLRSVSQQSNVNHSNSRSISTSTHPHKLSTLLGKLQTSSQLDGQTTATRVLTRLFSTNDTINITYIEPSGEPVTLPVPKDQREGESLMTLAVKNGVDMEGSCDGQIACSTCHCILSQEFYDHLAKLKPATDEELDMLDTAFGLTDTSRLGCQIDLTLIDDDLTVTLPTFSR